MNDSKLHYNISEVADRFSVAASLLRFWEKEFPQLKPAKNSAGIRVYVKEDIEVVERIYHYVKERGLTLKGAKQRLSAERGVNDHHYAVIKKLRGVRDELQKLYDEL